MLLLNLHLDHLCCLIWVFSYGTQKIILVDNLDQCFIKRKLKTNHECHWTLETGTCKYSTINMENFFCYKRQEGSICLLYIHLLVQNSSWTKSIVVQGSKWTYLFYNKARNSSITLSNHRERINNSKWARTLSGLIPSPLLTAKPRIWIEPRKNLAENSGNGRDPCAAEQRGICLLLRPKSAGSLLNTDRCCVFLYLRVLDCFFFLRGRRYRGRRREGSRSWLGEDRGRWWARNFVRRAAELLAVSSSPLNLPHLF
jgi:hypothetical protein